VRVSAPEPLTFMCTLYKNLIRNSTDCFIGVGDRGQESDFPSPQLGINPSKSEII